MGPECCLEICYHYC